MHWAASCSIRSEQGRYLRTSRICRKIVRSQELSKKRKAEGLTILVAPIFFDGYDVFRIYANEGFVVWGESPDFKLKSMA